jgi:hypothetical protein
VVGRRMCPAGLGGVRCPRWLVGGGFGGHQAFSVDMFTVDLRSPVDVFTILTVNP